MNTQLREIPKAELHRHLDGSVRFETIKELAQKNNLDLAKLSDTELFKKTKVIRPMKSLDEVLDCFWAHQQVLCNYESIKRVAFENVEDAFFDGVKLLELRFAPTFISENKIITNEEIIEAVIDGITEGMKKYKIEVGLIHIVPRSLDFEKNRQATKDIIRYKNGTYPNADRIVGFDLADNEAGTEAFDFLELVKEARDAELGITIHSGEDTDATFVKRAIELYRPERIGHGIKVWGNLEVMELVRKNNILLEVCPTSNWLTHSVESLEAHPFLFLYRHGISVSLNSDDPQLMNINLVNEYKIAHELYDLTKKDLYYLNVDSIKHSFLPEDIQKFVLKNYF